MSKPKAAVVLAGLAIFAGMVELINFCASRIRGDDPSTNIYGAPIDFIVVFCVIALINIMFRKPNTGDDDPDTDGTFW